MSTTNHDAALSLRRIVAFAILLLVSVIVPVGMVSSSIHGVMAGRPIGRVDNELPVYGWGSIRNGELWYPVYRFPGPIWSPPYQCRFMRMDLATGNQRETGLEIPGDKLQVIWINDDLYISGECAIYCLEGTSFEKLPAFPVHCFRVTKDPFLYDGRLSAVVEDQLQGGVLLVQLADGEWIKGRHVIIPGSNREWYADPERGRRTILPLTAKPIAPPRPKWTLFEPSLKVIQRGETTDLFFTDNKSQVQRPIFAAYRNGFEFLDGDADVASALATANSSRDVTGWEPIPSTNEDEFWEQAVVDRDGLIFMAYPRKLGQAYLFVRHYNEGQWEKIGGIEIPLTTVPMIRSLVVDSSNQAAHLICQDTNWNSTAFHRIEGNSIQPPYLELPGRGVDAYSFRLRRLLMGLFLAWLSHVAIVIGGILFFSQSRGRYVFGRKIASIASIGRRAGAFAIDLLVICSIMYMSDLVLGSVIGAKWESYPEHELSTAFIEFEWDHFGQYAPINFQIPNVPYLVRRFSELMAMLVLGHLSTADWRSIILIAILLCGLKSYVEGRYGLTPGKWLFGIRTLRSTFRPCGFARGMVRSILYWIDFPFFITPIPAAFSLFISSDGKRLGDRLADTIVVNRDSLIDDQPGFN